MINNNCLGIFEKYFTVWRKYHWSVFCIWRMFPLKKIIIIKLFLFRKIWLVASTQRYWSRGRVSRNINSFNHHSFFLDTGCLTKHDSWWIVLLPKFVKFNWYQRILHGSDITVKFISFLRSRYLFTYRGYYSLQDCYYGFNTKLFCDVIVYIQL